MFHLKNLVRKGWKTNIGVKTTASQTSGTLGLYSLSGKTSYRQISWSLEAARLGW